MLIQITVIDAQFPKPVKLLEGFGVYFFGHQSQIW